MKNFQQNLLILLALALCGLCAFQWYEQTQQRNAIGTLNRLVFQKNSDIQSYTNSIATLNQQVEQLDASLSEPKPSRQPMNSWSISQKAEITRLQFTGRRLDQRDHAIQTGR